MLNNSQRFNEANTINKIKKISRISFVTLPLLSLLSVSVIGLAGCTTIPKGEVFSPTNRIVQKTVVISPPRLKSNYAFAYGNSTALQRAYNTFLKTGKAPNIITDGFEQYAYGASQPIIAASPFELTVISLEPGEKVTNVSSGDPQFWSYSMAYSGSGDARQAHIMVKPAAENKVTNLVITTDKRMYTLKVVSGAVGSKYVRNVSYWYPEEAQAFWDNYNAVQSAKVNQSDTVASVPNLSVKDLNFNYSISCSWFNRCDAWKPMRIFDDGSHTYIQFPSNISNKDLPALFVLNGKSKEIVNYRVKAPYFIVDKVFYQAVLILGVGSNQSSVVITNHRYS